MNTEKLKLLELWKYRMLSMDIQTDTLISWMMVSPESPLITAVSRMMESYTMTTALLVGDDSEWLTWYWLECDLGRKPKQAGNGDNMRMIESINDLAELIDAQV
jgi:hypothetical protein